MAYGGFNRVLKSDGGDSWDGSYSLSATDNSETLNLNGFRRIAVWIDSGEATGTSPTLDVTLEFSPDAGTTWVAYPATPNSQTGAAMTQVTTSNDDAAHVEFYEYLINGPNVRYRFVMTLGGTSPVFPSFEARVIGWDRVDGSV